jgi:hypothetical protein
MSEIDITSSQAQRILRCATPGLAATSAYQPREEDMDLASAMLAAGYLEQVPGFASLEITAKGVDAREW